MPRDGDGRGARTCGGLDEHDGVVDGEALDIAADLGDAAGAFETGDGVGGGAGEVALDLGMGRGGAAYGAEVEDGDGGGDHGNLDLVLTGLGEGDGLGARDGRAGAGRTRGPWRGRQRP